MRPYLEASDGDWTDALDLYDWNAKVSAAFFESIHYLEVGLRNAMDQTLSAQWGDAWMSADSALLTPRSRHVVVTAQRKAAGPSHSHGKIIAELPFGFWWSLLADEYNRRLWQPSLRFAFTLPVRRKTLHAELNEIRQLRNRIAHHEPIHARDLAADFLRILDVAQRIAPCLGQHIQDVSRVASHVSGRPGRSTT